MANDLGYTPGAGALIKTDQDGGDTAHMQIVKLANSTPGSSTAIPASTANGLTVDVTRVQTVVPINDNGGSLTVDGSVVVSSVTAVVHVDDNAAALSVDDGGASLTVDGTVTAIQGTAAANAGAWTAKLTDGVDTVGISTVGGAKAMKVDVIQAVSTGVQTDKSAFVEGTGQAAIAGGVFNDTIGGDPAEDQAAALRITAKRGLHINPRNAAGVELGTAGNPFRVDPTNATVQSENITQFAGHAVVEAAAGIPKVGVTDATGTAYSAANPIPVQVVAQSAGAQWRAAVTFTASQTAVALHTPAGGKTYIVCGIIITPTAAGDALQIFDNTNAAANMLYQGSPPLASIVIVFHTPWVSAAANNVLRYTTGASAAGDITAYGYEL
jgi:hypothetical protein